MPHWPARRSHPERSYGSFQRSFCVPEGVDRDKIAADFSKGVLTVTMPKTGTLVDRRGMRELLGVAAGLVPAKNIAVGSQPC